MHCGLDARGWCHGQAGHATGKGADTTEFGAADADFETAEPGCVQAGVTGLAAHGTDADAADECAAHAARGDWNITCTSTANSTTTDGLIMSLLKTTFPVDVKSMLEKLPPQSSLVSAKVIYAAPEYNKQPVPTGIEIVYDCPAVKTPYTFPMEVELEKIIGQDVKNVDIKTNKRKKVSNDE